MTTAEQVSKALDTMYPDGAAPALFTGYDDGWWFSERPLDKARLPDLQAAFIGIAAPWLLARRIYIYPSTFGYTAKSSEDGESLDGVHYQSCFDAILAAVLAEGETDRAD